MKIVSRALLVVFGTLLGLVLVEALLRVTRPDLAPLVASSYEQDGELIHRTRPGSESRRAHPDTGVEHRVLFNRHGSHQHRDFSPTPAPGTTRIAVIGDSFTINEQVEAPYSFTEPLDHLLNATGRPFEVMNFGAGGYGTDQVFLWYRDDVAALAPQVVVYLFYRNDLDEILSNRLFAVRRDGTLLRRGRRLGTAARHVLRHLYLTYFLAQRSAVARRVLLGPEMARELGYDRFQRDVAGMLSGDPTAAPARRSVALFTALLRALRDELQGHGARFLVALAPERNGDTGATGHQAVVAGIAAGLGVEVLDLRERLVDEGPPYARFFFRSSHDEHWNEEGNKVAAVHLFRALAAHLGIPDPGNDFIRQALRDYYGSFQPPAVSRAWLADGEVDPGRAGAIRARYLALEASAARR